MAWYYGTFSCGHEGRVNITGPMKHREWKAERRFEGLCSECYENQLIEEREKANKEAEEKAKEMELPELTGSEKQVAWANTLRQKMIDNILELIENIDNIQRTANMYNLEDVTVDHLHEILDYILQNKTEAKYYIDNRDTYIFKILEKEIENLNKHNKEIVEKIQSKDIIAESTVYPENKITDVPVEIVVKDDAIRVYFEKNEKFIRLVKDLGYKWSGVWERQINYTNGNIEDRAAELGNKLLNEGFPIIILDKKTREKAISGEYEQECTRWIYIRTKGTYEGRLAIVWEGKSDRLYKTARSLPGSKWDSGVIVRVEHYKEVEEFAELYGFKFSKGAIKAIDEHKMKLENIEVVTPIEVEKKQEKDGLEEILKTDNEIISDLLDD